MVDVEPSVFEVRLLDFLSVVESYFTLSIFFERIGQVVVADHREVIFLGKFSHVVADSRVSS